MRSAIAEMLRKLAKNATSERLKPLCGPHIIDGIVCEKTGQRMGTYAVATDARTIVFTANWQDSLPWLTEEKARKALLTHFFPPDPLTPSWTGRLDELRSFCGEPVWKIACPECKGLTKTSNTYLYCSFCDNDGDVSPDVRVGYICDVPIDLNRVATAAELFPGEAIVAAIADLRPHGYKEGDGSRLWIIGQDFRIVVMGMQVTRESYDELFESWKNAPHFPLVEAAK